MLLHDVTDNTVGDLDGVKKVLAGESAIGKLSQYFLDTRAFNAKHGIEDDTGYGETNGYGTVRLSALEQKGGEGKEGLDYGFL